MTDPNWAAKLKKGDKVWVCTPIILKPTHRKLCEVVEVTTFSRWSKGGSGGVLRVVIDTGEGWHTKFLPNGQSVGVAPGPHLEPYDPNVAPNESAKASKQAEKKFRFKLRSKG